jgi:hypothetical protein
VSKRGPLIAVLLLVAVLVAASLPAASPASSCVNLHVTKKVKRALRKAHARLTSRPFSGPRRGSVYYGRCGSTHYALASFKDLGGGGYQDQPERFRRRRHHRWKDFGDTGGDGCGAPTPTALLHIWGFDHC